jgi:nucleoside-diphosphate-sugar epimerase
MNTNGYAGVRVLIFGAAGFIGRWVARHLSLAGANPTLVVRDADVARQVFTSYGVQGTVIAGSFDSANSVKSVFERVRPTITFNLAGYGVDRRQRDAARAFAINVNLVRWIAEGASTWSEGKWEGARVVHAGSALEYGTIGGNLAEDSLPHPTTPYGRTKLAGTVALVEESVRRNVRAVCARLFTVYGPGELRERLLPSLVEAASRRQPLALTTGTQARDFTFVGDVADGLLRLGLANATPGTIVNLATGRLTTVREFAEIAADALDLPRGLLRFGVLPPHVDEMVHNNVTVERLRHLIGWIPDTDVATGIRATAEFQLRQGRSL